MRGAGERERPCVGSGAGRGARGAGSAGGARLAAGRGARLPVVLRGRLAA